MQVNQHLLSNFLTHSHEKPYHAGIGVSVGRLLIMGTRMMRRQTLGLMVGALSLALSVSAHAEERLRPAAESTAGALVGIALRAEAAGQAEQRATFLSQARDQYPGYAPARWQSGFLKQGRKWLTVEAAQRAAAEDKKLQEYQRLRGTLPNLPAAQLQLARWCEKNGLDVEARLHWSNLLEHQPQNVEAQERLGVRWHEGNLLPLEEIARLEKAAAAADRAMRRWEPDLLRWRKDIHSGDAAARENALRQLRQITDAEAITPLETHISRHSAELVLEVVRVLDRMQDYRASQSLARHAVLSKWEEVRKVSAEKLAQRPLHDFVPMLLAGLAMPVQTRYEVLLLDGGIIHYTHTFLFEGPLAKTLISHEHWIAPIKRLRQDFPADRDERNLATMREFAERTERRFARKKASAMNLNQRIAFALEKATGEDLGSDPKPWREWWHEHNELHVQQHEKSIAKRSSSQVTFYSRYYTPNMSCFPRGTKVWGQTGLVPIETIQIGDRVLAQDPQTGELAFKPVLGTTLRPPSKLLAIDLGDETFTTTLGHPLWLSGTGWRMAKQVEAGSLLHGLHGSTSVSSISPAGEAEAHNLIVADFHNYFVGERGILAHDNTTRGPNTHSLPGLRRD